MSGILDYFKLVTHRKGYSWQDIQTYQLQELQSLLDFAKKNSPFYQHSLQELTLESLSDMKKLPIINKTIMMDHFNSLNTVGLKKDDVMKYAVEKELNKDYLGYYQDQFVIGLSSGTSGNKGIYITPKSLTQKLPYVFLARSGLPLRFLPFKILFMLRVFSQGFNDINSPLISLKYLSTMTPVHEVIDHINTHKINILMAPPSMCRLLLPYTRFIKKPLKMIVTYAEVLEREEKERLQEIFECKVIEIYQASEGQFASACPLGNLHINEDLVYVELLDEHYQEITQPHVVAKHMIATNLVNRAQPLIRYEMNDLIVLDDPCPCGSHFRTIKNILGRNDDVLTFTKKDGSKQTIFPDLMSRWIITTSENIREYKVFQHHDESLCILIDPLEKKDLYKLETVLIQRIKQECEAFEVEVKVDIKLESISLPIDKSKYKRFIVKNQ
jgi:putative adenylate-forming enzyme